MAQPNPEQQQLKKFIFVLYPQPEGDYIDAITGEHKTDGNGLEEKSHQEIMDLLWTRGDGHIKYINGGDELTPSTNRRHIQGYCELHTRMRRKKLLEIFFNCVVMPARGNVTSQRKYNGKSGLFIELGEASIEDVSLSASNKERWTEILGLAQEAHWDELQKSFPSEYVRYRRQLSLVHEEVMKPASNVKLCLWLFGEPGTGKSRFAHAWDDNVFDKACNKWWDNFDANKHKTVILDDFDKNHRILGHHLKRWADRYPVMCEKKGGSLYAVFDVLIVTSNYSIEEIWEDDKPTQDALKRRFHVLKVMGHEESLDGSLSIKTYDPYNHTGYTLVNKLSLINPV